MKSDDRELLEKGAALNMEVIAAGEERLAWVKTNWPIAAHAKSSRIVMDFDEQGELITYWETLFDAAGKQVIGGGISRDEVPSMGGTKTCRGFRFSQLQIQALIAGVDHKLARSCLGWWSDDGLSFFRPATIKSLHKRGLLDGNFNDTCVLDGDTAGVQTLDGARHEHSPEAPKFQVWTNAVGKELLDEMGFISDDD